jgi:hypothetical protein
LAIAKQVAVMHVLIPRACYLPPSMHILTSRGAPYNRLRIPPRCPQLGARLVAQASFGAP